MSSERPHLIVGSRAVVNRATEKCRAQENKHHFYLSQEEKSLARFRTTSQEEESSIATSIPSLFTYAATL
jgi:hypothetical protein